MPADDMDMRGILDDTMTKLGVKTPPLTVPAPAAPAAPAGEAPPKPPITRQEQLIGAGIGLVLLIIVSILWSRWQGAATVTPVSVATTISVPTAAPVPPTPPAVMLPAFAAPSGIELGVIESSRAITPTAHYGLVWIQADVAGSGLVWLRASDFPSLAIVGPDLAPRPTALLVPTRAPDLANLPDDSETATPAATVMPTSAPADTPRPTWDAARYQRQLDATATAIYATAHAIETETGQRAVVVPATPIGGAP